MTPPVIIDRDSDAGSWADAMRFPPLADRVSEYIESRTCVLQQPTVTSGCDDVPAEATSGGRTPGRRNSLRMERNGTHNFHGWRMMPAYLRRWFATRSDGRAEPRTEQSALEAEIEAALARRKAGRAKRQTAAVKGWDTRRAKA